VTIVEPVQLGTLIRRFRLAAGLSQEQLAERSGLSTRAVSDLERGVRSSTRPETLRMLADGLSLNEDGRAKLLAATRPELRLRSAETFPPAPHAAQSPTGLPASPGPLIGRDRDMIELVSELQGGSHRLITLTGPGGVGKTRLALEVAHLTAPSFSGGALFVDLAPITKPDLVASTIAQALGIREAADRSISDTLRAALASTPPLLLFLDNFEQVIEAAPLVSELMASAPQLQILTTSREALRVRGELEFAVRPLDLPVHDQTADPELLAQNPAVALFVQAAQSVKPGFALTADNSIAIADICRRLDGLPLAIELAAARIKYFPPPVLLEHLDQRLPLLVGGPRDLPARQQTLRNTIAWSYDLLTADDQVLFRRLGVFVEGADFEAIERVVPAAGDFAGDILSGVASLVEKSLLRQIDDAAAWPRFSMLELVREFALEQLARNEEYAAARGAHAQYFLEFTESRGTAFPIDFMRLVEVKVIDSQIENIHFAIDWFDARRDATSCARFAAVLWTYLYVRGRYREALALCQRSLELAESQPITDELRAYVLGWQSIATSVLGDPAGGESLARQSLQLSEGLPAETGVLGISLVALTIALRGQHRFEDALTCAERMLDTARLLGDEMIEPLALYHVGYLAYLREDLDYAKQSLSAAMSTYRTRPPSVTTLFIAQALGAALARRGETIEAARQLREGLPLVRDFAPGDPGHWITTAIVLAAQHALPSPAVYLLGFWSRYAVQLGTSADLVDPWLQEMISNLRINLGDAEFEAAFAAGTAMGLDDAIVAVQSLVDQVESTTPV
jgi:predicted ATPase/transcriptional regulator with XRE-family HTH domain